MGTTASRELLGREAARDPDRSGWQPWRLLIALVSRSREMAPVSEGLWATAGLTKSGDACRSFMMTLALSNGDKKPDLFVFP